MNTEKNKFLTEAMGECCHNHPEKTYYYDSVGRDFYYKCTKCNAVDMQSSDAPSTLKFKLVKTWDTIDFYTWEGLVS
jgi:hypothetical protein